MAQKKKDPYNFFLVAAGLLIGFFLGAAIIYLFNNRPADYQLTEAAQERLARLFQQQQQVPGPSLAPAENQPQTRVFTRQDDPEPASLPADTASLYTDTASLSADTSSLPADTAAVDTDPETRSHPHETADDSITTDHSDQEFSPDTGEQPSQGILEEEVRLKRDRLLGTIGFTLPTLESSRAGSESTRTLDSLLGGRHQPFRSILVEFWESPLNFTGYKMSKNSLILYGLDQVESVSLQVHEETVYLKYYGIYFPLVLTSDFLPLTAIEDALLINKLEQQWP